MDPVTVDLPPTRNLSASSLAVKAHERDAVLEAELLAFGDPQEVLAYPALGTSDKRAILAGWASDACAVANLPHWRRLPGTGALVPLDNILDALQALDGDALH
ncbi:hypothetical protein [Microvirga yunnanensis]|uniref:hypothetical protein n=1 Tax=Microvirga yunnanensis TaxID=2953740 RepID=UPI00290561A0|nr:hypothetical protein [Microvirga sp. HBU65207]